MSKFVLLHYLAKTGIWQQISLNPGLFTLGRSERNNLVLDDWMVSRQHASLRVEEDGVYILDQDSSNGILVAGERLPSNQWLPLKLDEDIIIGVTTLRVVDLVPPQPSEPDAPASNGEGEEDDETG